MHGLNHPKMYVAADLARGLLAKAGIAFEPCDLDGYLSADFIRCGGAHLVRTSTHYKGGITGGLRVAHLADAFSLRAEVHGGGFPNLHLACAIPNTTYYESLVRSNPITIEAGIGRDGCISPPQVPGIGWGTELSSEIPDLEYGMVQNRT